MKLRYIVPPMMFILGTLLLSACASSGVEKTLFVAPVTAECVGVAPQQCLLIKESPEEEWQFWYDPIEGFDYEQGFMYELLVEESEVENPPADASSIVLTLKEIVNQEPVDVKTVYIGPEQVECEGEGPQLCYLYKENPEDDWQFLYTGIDGFEYEPGYEYELIVAERTVANPPAGGSSIERSLVQVVSKNPVEPATLEGTPWELVSYNGGDQAVVDVLPDTKITALFEDGRISGSSGCNTYQGPYEATEETISIGPLATTLMACPEPVMDQEAKYLAALDAAATYQIVASRLELLDESGEPVAVFTVGEPAALEGTEWVSLAYNNGKEAVVSVIIGTEITALFEDGTVSGSAGCNNYSASYQVDGNNISIGPAVATRMFCGEPEGIMDQETQYLAALQSAATIEISDDRLLMFDASGARAVDYLTREAMGQ